MKYDFNAEDIDRGALVRTAAITQGIYDAAKPWYDAEDAAHDAIVLTLEKAAAGTLNPYEGPKGEWTSAQRTHRFAARVAKNKAMRAGIKYAERKAALAAMPDWAKAPRIDAATLAAEVVAGLPERWLKIARLTRAEAIRLGRAEGLSAWQSMGRWDTARQSCRETAVALGYAHRDAEMLVPERTGRFEAAKLRNTGKRWTRTKRFAAMPPIEQRRAAEEQARIKAALSE